MSSADNYSDLLHRLEDGAEDDYESWDGQPGDTICGELIRYEERKTRFGPALVAVIDSPDHDEPVGVWITPRNLRELFEKKTPRQGQRIGISRREDKSLTNGNTMKVFRLVVEGSEHRPPAGVTPDFLRDSSTKPADAALPEGSKSNGASEPDESIPF